MDLKSEDIRLDPDLYDSCRQDRIKLCQNVAFGNAQVSSHTQAAVNCLCRPVVFLWVKLCFKVLATITEFETERKVGKKRKNKVDEGQTPEMLGVN